MGQDNYMRNLHKNSQGTYENDRYAAMAVAAQENLLDVSVVNAGTHFFTRNVKGTMASRVFISLIFPFSWLKWMFFFDFFEGQGCLDMRSWLYRSVYNRRPRFGYTDESLDLVTEDQHAQDDSLFRM
jgi:hypothetical protein